MNKNKLAAIGVIVSTGLLGLGLEIESLSIFGIGFGLFCVSFLAYLHPDK